MTAPNSCSPGSAAVEEKLLSLNARWAAEGGPFDGEWVDEVMALMPRSPDVAATPTDLSVNPTAFINRRLEDLAEANALYGKDQRLSAQDKIARNDREISWLKNLRSMFAIHGPAQATRDVPFMAQEILDFLNSIEGAGYGGMASFEIVRGYAKDLALSSTNRGDAT